MKKICFIIPKGLPVPAVKGGAIESIITAIINKNEDNKDLDITVVSTYDKTAYLESKNYNNTKFIYVKPFSFNYFLKAINVRLKRLNNIKMNTYNEVVLKLIKNKKFDYIFVEDGAYQLMGNFLKYFKKEQMVLQIHHAGESNSATDKVFDKFISVSDYVLKKFEKTSDITHKYLLINSVDIKKFDRKLSEKEQHEIRKKLDINKNDFIIIFCGRLTDDKGVLELVRAVNDLEHDDIKLLIVGSLNFGAGGKDNYTKELEAEAKKKGKVIFTGYVENKDLYRFYKISNLIAIPSKFEDAAPLVCIESMLSQKPIITTGRGGIKEYTNGNAIYVDYDKDLQEELAKEIVNVYNNPEKYKDMVERAYQHALQFSFDNYYKNFLKIINEEFDNEK